jgi:uncharacterized membrane protein YfcA
LSTLWVTIATVSVRVALGTLLGSRVLYRIPDVRFHRVLGAVVAGLGTAMVVRAVRA